MCTRKYRAQNKKKGEKEGRKSRALVQSNQRKKKKKIDRFAHRWCKLLSTAASKAAVHCRTLLSATVNLAIQFTEGRQAAAKLFSLRPQCKLLTHKLLLLLLLLLLLNQVQTSLFLLLLLSSKTKCVQS